MKKLGLSIFVIAVAASGARADLSRGSQTAAIFGGAGGSSSNYDYEPGHQRPVTGGGGAFGGQYLYYVAGRPAIAIGADLASSLNGNSDRHTLLSGYDTTARTKSLVGLVVARLSFPHGIFRPYIFGGVGAHDSKQQLSARPQSGVTWPGGGTDERMVVDDHATSAAIGYGLGMDIYPTESFFLGLELRSTWLAGLSTDDTPALRAAGFTDDNENSIDQGNIFVRAGVKF
jgi:hypothetical protein